MRPILRVNVQNQMYYEDLNLMQMFQVAEHSRYLFLEFVKAFSLVVVANQGSYDLHIFRLVNAVDAVDGSEHVKMQREYIFKCPKWRERILGVSVVDNSREMDHTKLSDLQRSCRIYILTSDAKIHVLEVTRRCSSLLQTVRQEQVTKRVKRRVSSEASQRTVKACRLRHFSEHIMPVGDLTY